MLDVTTPPRGGFASDCATIHSDGREASHDRHPASEENAMQIRAAGYMKLFALCAFGLGILIFNGV
jgi:hypothetical protein